MPNRGNIILCCECLAKYVVGIHGCLDMGFSTVGNQLLSEAVRQSIQVFVESNINGVDVITMADRDFIELLGQYKKRSTEKFEYQQRLFKN